jgi:hypothetical protein
MKFDHILDGKLEVLRLDFDLEPLQDRRCSNCGSTVFYAVKVFAVEPRNSKFRAMCEGCKRIVELQ